MSAARRAERRRLAAWRRWYRQQLRFEAWWAKVRAEYEADPWAEDICRAMWANRKSGVQIRLQHGPWVRW